MITHSRAVTGQSTRAARTTVNTSLITADISHLPVSRGLFAVNRNRAADGNTSARRYHHLHNRATYCTIPSPGFPWENDRILDRTSTQIVPKNYQKFGVGWMPSPRNRGKIGLRC